LTEHEKKEAVIKYWLDKSDEAMESARMEIGAGRFSFAVNRIYYACFYAVSALLLKHGVQFKKHSGVRAALHKDFVKPGLLDVGSGKFYDLIYSKREQGDYGELVSFERDEVGENLEKAKKFIEAIAKLIFISP
jgi:uncharacterized protein (UPF0332 family)